MKYTLIIVIILVFGACSLNNESDNEKILESQTLTMTQNQLKNEKIKSYSFLKGMYSDSYFPSFLVDKIKVILIDLCGDIETQSPKSLEELYELSHKSTEKINDLENKFFENDSELETVAREIIAADFEFISNAYGFDADIEELIAPRNW